MSLGHRRRQELRNWGRIRRTAITWTSHAMLLIELLHRLVKMFWAIGMKLLLQLLRRMHLVQPRLQVVLPVVPKIVPTMVRSLLPQIPLQVIAVEPTVRLIHLERKVRRPLCQAAAPAARQGAARGSHERPWSL